MHKRSFNLAPYVFASLLSLFAGQTTALKANGVPVKLKFAVGRQSESAKRAGGLRDWTPADSIPVRYFALSDSELNFGVGNSADAIHWSPNRKYFFFTTYRGDLACDCNTYELSVYSADAIIAAIKGGVALSVAPLKVIAVQAPQQAITDAKWRDDSEAILYTQLGEQLGETFSQDYQLLIQSLQTSKRDFGSGRVAHVYSRGEGTIIEKMLDEEGGKSFVTRVSKYPMHPITNGELGAIVGNAGRLEDDTVITKAETIRSYAQYKTNELWPLTGNRVATSGPWFAPSGKRAIIIREPIDAPAAWRGDADKIIGDFSALRALMGLPRQFFLVDLEQGKDEPIINAPTGEYLTPLTGGKQSTSFGFNKWGIPAEAYWSSDESDVVLVNTTLPTSTKGADPSMAFLISVNLKSKKVTPLEPLNDQAGGAIISVRWGRVGKQIIVERNGAGSRPKVSTYDFDGNDWIPNNNPPGAPVDKQPGIQAEELSVELIQGPNEPPKVVASAAGKNIELTDKDPALAKLRVAKVQQFSWKDEKGGVNTGGLLLPPAQGPTAPPLIIQVGFNFEDRFLPDGMTSTAFASQALVARGFAVLNLESPYGKAGRYEEYDDFRRAWESAVKSLAEAKLVDPQRIGLIGFSHFGLLVREAITHHGNLPIGAAVIADSNTGSYNLYLNTFSSGSGRPTELENIYGGRFAEAKQSWLERETTFNVEKIDTPVLFIGSDDVYALETVGSFKANRKAFEFLVFPELVHNLKRPRQREASMAANVDWMSFWLQGFEDPDSSKKDQYARWRKIRSDWERQKRWEAAGHPRGSRPVCAPGEQCGS